MMLLDAVQDHALGCLLQVKLRSVTKQHSILAALIVNCCHRLVSSKKGCQDAGMWHDAAWLAVSRPAD